MNLTLTPSACWLCVSFDGLTANGMDALCKHPGCSRHRTNAAAGCSAFVREIGVEGDWVPEAFAAARERFERHQEEFYRRKRG